MKRIGNLYYKICDFQNLHLAFYKTAKGRRYDHDILKFKTHLEENLIQLQIELLNKTYSPSPYRTFKLYEPKERTIYVSPVKDRIVHHAVMNIIEPIWDRLFISDSYACRKGKGTHAGMQRTVSFLRKAIQKWNKAYCLKCDISRFFPSINHHILLQVIQKKIKCKDTLWLFETIIFNNSADKNDLESKNMPIGNLISQWSANLYLNELDHYIKHILKIEYYIRYMDDFILLHEDKTYLREIKSKIIAFLSDRLKLKLNPKSDIFPINRGIDFLGYRTWHNNILLRKKNIIKSTKRFKKLKSLCSQGLIDRERIKCSVNSWLGHCKHANATRVIELCVEKLK